MVRYIHQNSVGAGIVRDMDRYRWSSQRAYLQKGTGPGEGVKSRVTHARRKRFLKISPRGTRRIMTVAAGIRKESRILTRKRTEKDFSLWFEMTKQHRLPEYLPHDWLVPE